MTMAIIRAFAPFLFGVFLAACVGVVEKQSTESGWSVTMGELDDRLLIIRKNRDALAFSEGSGAYQYRVMIVAGIQDADKNGLPSTAATKTLYKFEDRIDHALIETESVIAMVVTTSGMRQFIYYTAEPEKLTQILDVEKSNNTALPWGYEITKDPEWSLVR